jgi:hypothetical protein
MHRKDETQALADNSPPMISLLHPTARPHRWEAVHRAWLRACAQPERVEYVLVPEWDLDNGVSSRFGRLVIKRNQGRPCLVDAFNQAAALSTGRVLVVIADDFFPFPLWDVGLLHTLEGKLDEQVAVWASTGGANDARFIVHPILTRAYYERYGFLFWYEYEAWFADNEFSDVAHRDGVVLDARKVLRFDHCHPSRGLVAADAINQRQDSRGASIFRSVYERRKRDGFPRP